MASSWPITLPQKTQKDGFSKLPGVNVTSTANDRGPLTVRRVGTTVYVKYRVSFKMTTSEVIIFEDFFNDDLISGSLEYQWLDPITGIEYFWVIDQSQNTYALTNIGGEVYNVAFVVIRKDTV